MKVHPFRRKNQEILSCPAGEYGQAEMTFNPSTGAVDFFIDGHWIYGLNAKFRDATEALDWIRQIAQKKWASTQTISNLCTFALGALK